MAVNTRTLDISLSVSAGNSGEAASTTKNILANLALSGKTLANMESYAVHSVAGAGNVVITPPAAAIVANMECIVIPYFDAGESFSSNKFRIQRVVSGTTHVTPGGPTIAACSLLGTETSVTLYNDGSNTAEFAVIFFKRSN
jgi:hypothetical protein